MQPFREQQIDLVDMLLKRGVARGIILDVIGRPQALSGVQCNVGGFQPVLAAHAALLRWFRKQGRIVTSRRIRMPRSVEEQLWQWSHPYQTDNEDGSNHTAD